MKEYTCLTMPPKRINHTIGTSASGMLAIKAKVKKGGKQLRWINPITKRPVFVVKYGRPKPAPKKGAKKATKKRAPSKKAVAAPMMI